MIFERKPAHLVTGRRGEKTVCREMQRMGLTVLKTNYAVHGAGEIDIIGRDGSCLVFVEVKTRTNTEGSRPGEAVNSEKKKKIWKTAQAFMRELGRRDLRYRFDVAEVYFKTFFRSDVLYLPGAFSVDDVKKSGFNYGEL